jgi:hypothetical protein
MEFFVLLVDMMRASRAFMMHVHSMDGGGGDGMASMGSMRAACVILGSAPGVLAGLVQVSVRFCLEDLCGGGIVCHGCALSIGYLLNSGGEAMWGSVHHPLLFHPLFCLGRRCAGDVRIEELCQRL